MSRTAIASRRAVLRRTKRAAGGIDVPTGDQAQSNPFAHNTWDGLEPAPKIWLSYGPFESVAVADTASIGWRDSASSGEPFSLSRLFAWGPAWLSEDAASILSVFVGVQGGTAASAIRAGYYRDNGNATNNLYIDAATTVTARPSALGAMSAELAVAANRSADWIEGVLNTGAESAGFLWPAVWHDNTSNGVQILTYPSGTSSLRVRTNSSISPYSSAGAAPSTFPGDSNTTRANRAATACYLTYRPVAPTAPTGLTATPTGTRGVALTWTNTDSRTTRTRIERQQDGGAWAIVAVVEGSTSYADTDLVFGSTYTYRVVACYKNAQSANSSTASAVIAGVRQAYATLSPALRSVGALYSRLFSGIYGRTHTVPGISQIIGYIRSPNDGTNWGTIQSTSDPNVFDWSGIDNYLANLPAGQRATIRIRCGVPGTGTSSLPPFVTADTAYYGGSTSNGYYPKWNNAQVWTWLQNLITAFGNRYKNDPRVAYFKVGIYAQFGEGTGEAGPDPATDSRLIEIIDAMVAAVSPKKCVASMYDSEAVMWHCMQLVQAGTLVGIEQLALGDAPYMYRQIGADRSARLRQAMQANNVWRTTEHYRTYSDSESGYWELAYQDMVRLRFGDISDRNLSTASGLGAANLARLQNSIAYGGYRFDAPKVRVPAPIARGVPQPWGVLLHNSGVSVLPNIDAPRQLQLELRQGGSVTWAGTLVSSLATIEPTTGGRYYSGTFTVDAAPGSYDLYLRSPSLSSRIPAIALGLSGAESDGGHPLGTVTVQ